MVSIIKIMTADRAIKLLDGREEWNEAREYLDACFCATKPENETIVRPLMSGPLFRHALMVIQMYVALGEDETLGAIAAAKAEMKAAREAEATKHILETKDDGSQNPPDDGADHKA